MGGHGFKYRSTQVGECGRIGQELNTLNNVENCIARSD